MSPNYSQVHYLKEDSYNRKRITRLIRIVAYWDKKKIYIGIEKKCSAMKNVALEGFNLSV